MRLAIMQPYFFPYQGYFQLIAAVDRFVVYDDVAFMKNGWVNRNRILTSSGAEYFTVPLAGASSFRAIRETNCAPPSRWREKMLRTLTQVYARAPHREEGMELVRRVLEVADSESVRDLALASLREVCLYAGLAPSFQDSSSAYGNAQLSGVERVLDICRREGATTYVNAPGGRALYDPALFEARGLQLRFLSPTLEPYPQPRAKEFVAGLSVLDLVMSVPFLLCALALVSVFGPSLSLSIGVIVFFSWTTMGRVIRGQVMSLRRQEFVEASRSLGAGPLSIMFIDILPNLSVPIIVYTTLMIPGSMMIDWIPKGASSTASPSPRPSWANFVMQ